MRDKKGEGGGGREPETRCALCYYRATLARFTSLRHYFYHAAECLQTALAGSWRRPVRCSSLVLQAAAAEASG